MNTSNLARFLYAGGLYIYRLGRKLVEKIIFITSGKEDKKRINEVLVYGVGENEEQMRQIGLNNLLCICYVILRASRSVEVCVTSLVSDTLARRLVTVRQKKKLKIRIIIHKSKNFRNLELFLQNGIEVKVINPVVQLQYEFLLIDAIDGARNGIAVMGSLDYETGRVNCNRDATLITSEDVVVTSLKREFDRVWNSVTDHAN